MLQKIITSKKFLISLSLLTLFVVISSIIKTKTAVPELISSSPANNSTNFSVVGPIELKFNSTISASDFLLSSIPEMTWALQQQDGFSLTASHTATLQAKTQYVLKISWRNKIINTITFNTEATQTDYELIKNVKKEVNRDYPMAMFTPYSTSGYLVVYSTPLTLEITIKNPNLTRGEVIDEVKSWVTENGGDVAAHKFVIANP